jgi:hypothetical protein
MLQLIPVEANLFFSLQFHKHQLLLLLLLALVSSVNEADELQELLKQSAKCLKLPEKLTYSIRLLHSQGDPQTSTEYFFLHFLQPG